MDTSLNICVLAQRVPFPPNKGEKLRSYHQIKHLVEQGYTVQVLSLAFDSKDVEHAEGLRKSLGVEVSLFDVQPTWQRYTWALLNDQALSVGAFYSKALLAHLVSLVRTDRSIDLIYLTASSLVYYIQRLTNNSDQIPPVMVDFMDVDSDKWMQYAANASLPMKWVYRREATKVRNLEEYANTYFAACFLIADEEVNLFKRDVSNVKPVSVLGNGMAFDEFYPPIKIPEATPAVFVFTGVMDYKPNIDAVVWFVEKCWPRIIERHPDSQFYIVGMNPIAQIKALQSIEGVHVTGFVDEVLPYYHQATAFVAPFRLARGVQNKVLQAAACNIPIITTPMGAEGIDFANDTTMYFATDETSFANACIESIEQRETSLHKASKALKAIRETYSWEQKLVPLQMALEQI